MRTVGEGPEGEKARQDLARHHRPPPGRGDDVEDRSWEEVDEVYQGQYRHQGGEGEDDGVPPACPAAEDLLGPSLEGEARHEAVDGGKTGEVDDQDEGALLRRHRDVILLGWYLELMLPTLFCPIR